MYYGGHFLLGQIIEAINPPENIANHVCKDREVEYYSPRYDASTSHFLGLYETVSYLVARGDDDDHFLGYGFCEENSNGLYSYHKHGIPNLRFSIDIVSSSKLASCKWSFRLFITFYLQLLAGLNQ